MKQSTITSVEMEEYFCSGTAKIATSFVDSVVLL